MSPPPTCGYESVSRLRGRTRSCPVGDRGVTSFPPAASSSPLRVASPAGVASPLTSRSPRTSGKIGSPGRGLHVSLTISISVQPGFTRPVALDPLIGHVRARLCALVRPAPVRPALPGSSLQYPNADGANAGKKHKSRGTLRCRSGAWAALMRPVADNLAGGQVNDVFRNVRGVVGDPLEVLGHR